MLEKKQRIEMKERRVKIERQMRKKHGKYLPNDVSQLFRQRIYCHQQFGFSPISQLLTKLTSFFKLLEHCKEICEGIVN